jgi:hypothetical protein
LILKKEIISIPNQSSIGRAADYRQRRESVLRNSWQRHLAAAVCLVLKLIFTATATATEIYLSHYRSGF